MHVYIGVTNEQIKYGFEGNMQVYWPVHKISIAQKYMVNLLYYTNSMDLK